MTEVVKMEKIKREIREIKLYVKGEFEDWENAVEKTIHGYEISERENPELFEFVEKLLRKTYYDEFVVTRIYKTIEEGFVVILFSQTGNEYGGYCGTIETYATIDDIVKNIKREENDE
jgi:hypothetical protein